MIKKVLFVLFTTIASVALVSPAFSQGDSEAPADARAYIVSPADGATVSSPVTVVFGLSGMGVAPAGSNLPNTGHHHLIINAPLPDTAAPVPADDNHKHFGKGQTETTIELAPGKHTLQLLMGDWKHLPHNNVIASEQITIAVE